MNRNILTIALGLALLLASTAQARFIMFDAIYDTRPVGSSLDRRGARFGEPVESVGDNHSEVIVQDGPGDRSVQIWDTTSSTPDHLTFALLDGREVTDGKVNISLELQPDVLDTYKVAIEGPDPYLPSFVHLSLDGAGFLYWSDGDDIAVYQFGTYNAGDVLLIELAFDLNNGTYDFTLDGTPIYTDEAHGITAYGVAHVVVGNQFDGNASGSVRLDNLSVDFAPGTADDLLTANFNNEPIGQPIGTGGAELGQPISYDHCTPTVESGVFPTPSLQLADQSASSSSVVRFEFLDSAEIDGDVSISFWLELDSLESYFFGVREQGGAAEQFLELKFVSSGTVWFDDEASAGTHYHSESYAAQTPIHIEVAFYGELGLYSVWMDDVRVVHRRAHGITDRGIGRLHFGASFDNNYSGRMRIDNIKVDTFVDPVTSVDEDATPALIQSALAAAPNPFNPATSLRFSLPKTGQVQLYVVDLRGRRVAHLLSETMAAGDHETTWRGNDAGGRPVASGVYHALLQVDGQVQGRLPLTLLK